MQLPVLHHTTLFRTKPKPSEEFFTKNEIMITLALLTHPPHPTPHTHTLKIKKGFVICTKPFSV